MKRLLFAAMAVVALAVTAASPAFAATTTDTTTFRGQGLIADGFGGYDLVTELCGTKNGADADGPYLLWVFTSTKATTATITGPWGTADMTKTAAGTFKYVSAWYDPDTLTGMVTAKSDRPSSNPQLVISHGCRPYSQGAWCSPGFWRNAEAGAWALTGYTRDDSFNALVPFYWFGNQFAANPTLGTVLANSQTYSNAPVPGTSGYQLNAFNATGAMLTDALPGFEFSWDVMVAGTDAACPIDHKGDLKTKSP